MNLQVFGASMLKGWGFFIGQKAQSIDKPIINVNQ